MSSRYSQIHQVYIADGFADDCEEIIHRCSKIQTLTYQTFTEIWKDMNFADLYKGRTSGAEIAELSEEVIYIAKHYMVADTSNFEETVAGLFLVYALVNLQPFSNFAWVRVTPEDVVALKRISVVARRQRRDDVLYTLGSVLMRSQFHADRRERGMDPPLRKYLEGFTTIDKMGVRPKGVFYRQNEELDLIRELGNVSRRYDEAKAAINAGKGQIDRNLNYSDSELPKTLGSSLKMIINGIINDEEESEQPDHYSSVQSIKYRAMKETVNPIKHLTGVKERKNLSPKKSPTAKSTQVSPKPTTSSPRKRVMAQNKIIAKKQRKRSHSISSDSDTDDEILDLREFNKNRDMVDLNEPNGNNTDKNNFAVNEQEINIEIDALPIFIRTETADKTVEIEIIDNYQQKTTNKKETKKQSLHGLDADLTISKIPSKNSDTNNTKTETDMAEISKMPKIKDDHVFKKPNEMPVLKKTEKREQRKTILKSKFKRLGILPVANFEDTK